MREKALLTRPNHDIVTQYLFEWSKEWIAAASENGASLMDLSGEKANKDVFQSYVRKHRPSLILLNGHGSADMVCGFHNQPLLFEGNVHELKGSIVYARSCDSAARLGKMAVKSGVNAFIGYDLEFGFVTMDERQCTPQKDKFAEPFKRASNAVGFSLIKGRTVQEAYEKSQSVFREEMQRHAVEEAQPQNNDIRFWLFWDMQCQKIMGNLQAKFA